MLSFQEKKMSVDVSIILANAIFFKSDNNEKNHLKEHTTKNQELFNH